VLLAGKSEDLINSEDARRVYLGANFKM
jgi:ABC-type lipopolysaccharide export system ATPase subunit